MIVARKQGCWDWLIPESYRLRFAAEGFTHFASPPTELSVADYPEPILLEDAIKSNRMPSEAVTGKAVGTDSSVPTAASKKKTRADVRR